MHATPKSAIASTVAVDLAKDVFELAFADADARILERRRLTRAAFAKAFDNRSSLRIVMEASGSAHYWARRFTRLGHTVELLPAHDVRPYVRRNETDRTDAVGLLEATRCASIRRVPAKTPEQQGIAARKQQPLDRTRAWALALSERVGHNKAAVALANKQARRLWAAEHHRTSFDPDHVSVRATSTVN